jgi:outer membrane receptor protein involved in Fe transport
MQRSRSRKLKKMGASGRATGISRMPVLLRRAPIAAAIMVAVPRLYAADTADTGGLAEVVVTAEKRTENLQDVPLSITAIGTEKLQQLGVQNFDDYVKFLPSVAYQSFGPGFARVFMRGVSSGDNGNHSGPLPSVGVYLDEQPITTIQGSLDVHVYDIERVEALAGPQGTLYGASSEAGTVRIITNKPDAKAFKAGYDLQGDTVRGQGGYVAEGFVNLPLSANAAVRLVGWAEHDGGFIDNVPGNFTYPSTGICLANTNPAPTGCVSTPTLAKKRFNDVDTYGARAALKVDLNDNWTLTPTLMGQKTDSHGNFAVDPAITGDLSTNRYYPDSITDKWWQLALTLEGKISNFDITYAGGYLKRDDRTQSDYSDYSFLYDKQTTYTAYLETNVGHPINPSQHISGTDGYRKMSHELRVTTPKDSPLRFIGGLFYERQQHYILQNYLIDQLPPVNSVTGWPATLWLTDQIRVDRDYAVFGELSYDLTPKLTATVGYRFFRYDNSLGGFFGFGANNPIGSHSGERATTFQPDGTRNADGTGCLKPGILGGPCVDLSNEVKKDGSTPKFNLTYKFDDNHMVYATYSRGFRPGGINRRTQAPPAPALATYDPDFLKNYEVGFKTSWLNNHLRFNGALFWEDWKNFQFGFLGQNSFTIVRNAGSARIRGAEQELEWAVVPGFTLSAAATELDPKLNKDFCLDTDPATGSPYPLTTCPAWDAVPSGTQLPTTPKFKGNVTARYTFGIGQAEAHLQGAYVYQAASNSQLSPAANAMIGTQPAYGIFDFAGGLSQGNFSAELFVDNVFDKRAELYRFAECTIFAGSTSLFPGVPICALKPLANINTPRMIGLRFGQRF